MQNFNQLPTEKKLVISTGFVKSKTHDNLSKTFYGHVSQRRHEYQQGSTPWICDKLVDVVKDSEASVLCQSPLNNREKDTISIFRVLLKTSRLQANCRQKVKGLSVRQSLFDVTWTAETSVLFPRMETRLEPFRSACTYQEAFDYYTNTATWRVTKATILVPATHAKLVTHNLWTRRQTPVYLIPVNKPQIKPSPSN